MGTVTPLPRGRAPMSKERTVNSVGLTVALRGSFQHHYKDVCSAWLAFSEAEIKVTTPKGAPIIEHGIPFVRFSSDPKSWTDPEIQTLALHRIFRSDFVFVVAPSGYVGRTTCYEIGRVIQAKRPLYFSEYPNDLPINVPKEYVKSVNEIINLVKESSFLPKPMYLSEGQNRHECDLLNGIYKEDEHFQSYET